MLIVQGMEIVLHLVLQEKIFIVWLKKGLDAQPNCLPYLACNQYWWWYLEFILSSALLQIICEKISVLGWCPSPQAITHSSSWTTRTYWYRRNRMLGDSSSCQPHGVIVNLAAGLPFISIFPCALTVALRPLHLCDIKFRHCWQCSLEPLCCCKACTARVARRRLVHCFQMLTCTNQPTAADDVICTSFHS